MNIIFPLSVVDVIMGGLVLCMNSCMYACIMNVCLSLYTYVGVHACMCVRLANDLSMSKRKQDLL